MTSSKSSSWRRRVALVTFVLLGVLLGTSGVADAGRKRLVVLEFDGDKAEKFHGDLVKFLKKSHTVITTEKWNTAADELGASKVTDKNVKKVAKKLKIDGVISGTVEKRRDEYILRIKLRAGGSGALVGSQVNIKADGPKLDSGAQSDLKDELFDSIDSLESNRGGGDEEEEEVEAAPAKKIKKEEPVEEEKPAKKGFSKKAEPVEEVKPAKKAPKLEPKEVVEKDEEEDSPLPAPKKGKQVAAKEDDEEEGVEETAERPSKMKGALARSPGNRAIDAAVGMSFTMRRLGFIYDANRATKPAGYKGTPVAGAVLDLTFFPLAVGHKEGGMLKNLGATVMIDKVLVINSKDAMGNKLTSSQARYAVGVTFRYPLGRTATSPVVGVSVRYGRQNFTIEGNSPVPNVNYTIIDPQLHFKYPLSTTLALNASVGYMLISNTGGIQKADEYGAATVGGVEGALFADYMITSNIFARGALKFETIGFKFKGTGTKTMDGAVGGARDTYIGAAITGGYFF
ncbi:MAG: hypothetical protein H0T89_01940 [Deltaproteobacteria bacterium]|nr:hypothetical protein [Deltaproteobacteria bacterium]MDQ3299586.1 hypothetical protein [Myxococcota bacterium]